ncbi:MAG: rRNA maturation RNase YbeY [Phycisphaerales bacterium]|nr:rRNA maturation RNase YbeY [Phycisphaerales bacterium]
MPDATDTAAAPEDGGSSAEGDLPPERADHPADLHHDIQIDPGPLQGDQVSALCAAVDAALPNLDRPVARVGLQVVCDREMIELHRRWHDLDTTTDVLTFEANTEGPIDVDIAVCFDEARRQAQGRGHDWQDELLLYVLHGLLHCCGHDDHTPESQSRMFDAQDALLISLGRDPISKDA